MVKINVVIVGQKWLAVELLKLCLKHDLNITAVIAPSAEDKLSKIAFENNIPVCFESKIIKADLIPTDTDLILCAHSHAYVSAHARLKSTYGAVGYHPSLLPKYRGKDAIQQALDHGDLITGGSLYQLDDGWDTGQVLSFRVCEIVPHETAQELWQRALAPIGLELFDEAIKQWKSFQL